MLLDSWEVLGLTSAIDILIVDQGNRRNFGLLGHIAPGRRGQGASWSSPLDLACSITLVSMLLGGQQLIGGTSAIDILIVGM